MLDVCQPYLSHSLSVSPVLVIQFHLSLWKPLFLVTCTSVWKAQLYSSSLFYILALPVKSFQFMWTYFQVIISVFTMTFTFSCDFSFNIHEFKQLQYATFAHILAQYPEQLVFSTHIFLIFLTSPSLTHLLSLYLSLCVFMCTMCVRPSRVFSLELCCSVGIDCLSWCFPAALLYSGSLRPSSPVVSSQTQHPDLSAVNASILCYMRLASSNCATE